MSKKQILLATKVFLFLVLINCFFVKFFPMLSAYGFPTPTPIPCGTAGTTYEGCIPATGPPDGMTCSSTGTALQQCPSTDANGNGNPDYPKCIGGRCCCPVINCTAAATCMGYTNGYAKTQPLCNAGDVEKTDADTGKKCCCIPGPTPTPCNMCGVCSIGATHCDGTMIKICENMLGVCDFTGVGVDCAPGMCVVDTTDATGCMVACVTPTPCNMCGVCSIGATHCDGTMIKICENMLGVCDFTGVGVDCAPGMCVVDTTDVTGCMVACPAATPTPTPTTVNCGVGSGEGCASNPVGPGTPATGTPLMCSNVDHKLSGTCCCPRTCGDYTATCGGKYCPGTQVCQPAPSPAPPGSPCGCFTGTSTATADATPTDTSFADASTATTDTSTTDTAYVDPSTTTTDTATTADPTLADPTTAFAVRGTEPKCGSVKHPACSTGKCKDPDKVCVSKFNKEKKKMICKCRKPDSTDEDDSDEDSEE